MRLFKAAGSPVSIRCSFLTVAALLWAAPVLADDAQPRGVVELFTSQGCSSCPPADRLAYDLARDERILVLTLPVDLWDYLGWKDTLASPMNTARQRAYAIARGDRKVYTPQIVVNGREAAVGNDGAAVIGAITRAETDSALSLPVSLKVGDGRVEVSVKAPRGPLAQQHGEVWAFALERSHTVQIGRGENAGRTATYANVVRSMIRLGAWDNAPAKFEIPSDEVMKPGADGVAVIVQAGNGGQPGPILGAAESDHPPLPPLPATTTSRLLRDTY
jgi:hypothetical protein